MDEILNLIESVSEGFPTYSYNTNRCTVREIIEIIIIIISSIIVIIIG